MECRLISVPENDANTARGAELGSLLGQGDTVDLGEYWTALHFTLTSEFPVPKEVAFNKGMEWDDDSLENLFMGGQPLGDHPGFSRMRLHSESEVRKLFIKLKQIATATFLEWYDPQEMEENSIPPQEAWDMAVDGKHSILLYFQRLKEFFVQAATKQLAVIVAFRE